MSGTVIVTGAAGFIGSHLAASLVQAGHDVVGIDNFDGFYDRPTKEQNLARIGPARFRLKELDIGDRDGLEQLMAEVRPVRVVHLAALAGVRPSLNDAARFSNVNITGLTNVLDAARAAECSRVVFASSSSVYGNNTKVPFAETDVVAEPISPYAATKRAGELMCHTYCHLYGMSIAALRLFTVFGPSQRPDLAIQRFMKLIAAGEEIPRFGDGSTSRDYTYVDDIVAGINAAAAKLEAESDGFSRVFNLGGSHPTTLSDMIEMIGSAVGRTPKIKELPMQPGDVERTFADLSRSHAELGYEPQVDFATGLARQWDWNQRTARS